MRPVLASEDVYLQLRDHPAWIVERTRLYRDFRCASFKEAIALVVRVADLAESLGHHPNILVHEWCFVRLELYSHLEGGLTKADVDFALAADEMLAS